MKYVCNKIFNFAGGGGGGGGFVPVFFLFLIFRGGFGARLFHFQTSQLLPGWGWGCCDFGVFSIIGIVIDYQNNKHTLNLW